MDVKCPGGCSMYICTLYVCINGITHKATRWKHSRYYQGNSANKLRYTRSVAYSAELVLLNKHQISGGRA